jgi:hypothetical protein
MGERQFNGRFVAGYTFTIVKGRNKIIGGFDVGASTMAIALWKRNDARFVNGESLKNLFLAVLPAINVPISDQEGTNAEGIWFEILFGVGNSGYDAQSRTLRFDPENSPEELVEKMVYNEEITDEKVQDNLLRFLAQSFRENSSRPIPLPELKASFFLDERTFESNIDHLWVMKRVTISEVNSGGTDSRHVTISSIGREYLIYYRRMLVAKQC